jgi:metal-responsive CopG/Arc/MetJ family transcriptional regulator
MKTELTIPDEIYIEAERLAEQVNKTRSQLYTEALQEYVARHAPIEITDAVNAVCDEIGERNDPFIQASASYILGNGEWCTRVS